MAIDHSKFLARFVDEAREHCARLTEGLLLLERSPGDAEAMASIFRSAHTIKGSARMMKLIGISELAHAMEDVLDAARGGKLTLTPAVSDALFRGIDALSAMLEQVGPGGQPEAPEALRAELHRLAAGAAQTELGLAPAPASALAPAPAPESASEPSRPGPDSGACGPEALAQEESPGPAEAQAAPKRPGSQVQSEYMRVNSAKLDALIRLMGEIISEHGLFRKEVQQLGDIERASRRHLEALTGLFSREEGGSEERAPKELGRVLRGGETLHQTLRRALTGVSESVMLQEHLIAELQETSLKLRMLPLSTVFDPLRRTVRDLACECGKEIDFVIEGGETELDRKITERIGDSLMHMIRNSLDHGIESAEERERAGKRARGSLSLSAFHDSGGVTIALRDDGRGLSTEKIREKALARRMFDADTLARMSRAEVNNLIFLPGFSTSPIITDISGRGVGMDVVRRNIVDELKGTITIETTEGAGSAFLLRLPLNLAVFPLFLVSTGGTVCAIPSIFVVEMLSVARAELINIVDKRAIRLREQLVPVEDLAAILKISGQAQSKEATLVVVQEGESKLGLLVDEILGREEMVVKPLPAHLQNVRIVIGGTIGEGGGVINVLHVPEVLRLAREMADSGRKVAAPAEERGASILVVDDSINTREIEKSILEAYGYTVDMAEDGQEALEKTRTELYDLVVTDVEMPRMDGFSLTESLRADQRYRNVPVIIVTSREKDEDKKRGILVGADAYIVKRAFDQSNLLDTVRSLIG